MTVTIGHLTFDGASYDEQGDVLYLHVAERQAAADSEKPPKGTSCDSTQPAGSSA